MILWCTMGAIGVIRKKKLKLLIEPIEPIAVQNYIVVYAGRDRRDKKKIQVTFWQLALSELKPLSEVEDLVRVEMSVDGFSSRWLESK